MGSSEVGREERKEGERQEGRERGKKGGREGGREGGGEGGHRLTVEALEGRRGCVKERMGKAPRKIRCELHEDSMYS
jgi:hypothetical protein